MHVQLFIAMLIGCGHVLAAPEPVPDPKVADWNNLEDILHNLDDIDNTQQAQFDDPPPPPPHRRPSPYPQRQALSSNPCEDRQCGWGKECVLRGEGDLAKPNCECIKQCPPTDYDPFTKACSNQNETYDSLCHLYQERCLCKRGESACANSYHSRAQLAYLGPCKQLDSCPPAVMSQFAERMSEWLFQVMRDMNKRQELLGDEWLDLLQEAEHNEHSRHVYPVIWKFCTLDTKPHDRSVTKQELIPLMAPVIPQEGCIKPFIDGCDANNDDTITLKEWGKCLGLLEEEIMERCGEPVEQPDLGW